LGLASPTDADARRSLHALECFVDELVQISAGEG
jgi:hypothetical protein